MKAAEGEEETGQDRKRERETAWQIDTHTQRERERAEIKATIRIVKTKAMHEVDAVLHAEPQGDSSKGRTTHTHTHSERDIHPH